MEMVVALRTSSPGSALVRAHRFVTETSKSDVFLLSETLSSSFLTGEIIRSVRCRSVGLARLPNGLGLHAPSKPFPDSDPGLEATCYIGEVFDST